VSAPARSRRIAVDPRIGARRTAVARERGRRRLRVVLAVTCAAALLVAALVVLRSRRWPGEVVAPVAQPTAVAVIPRPAPAAGYALVDATGRVLRWTGDPPAGLPVLQAPVAVPAPGKVLGPAARPGLAVAVAAGGILAGRLHAVSVDPRGVVRLDLGGGVEVLVGRALSLGPKLAALRSVLAGAPPQGPELIDVTVPGEPTVAAASP